MRGDFHPWTYGTVCLLVNFQRPKVESKRIVNGYQTSESAE